MFHQPAASGQAKDLAMAYKTRLGAWMFLAYALIYAGFVAINLVAPALMAATVWMGLNLAVVYGFGLIGFALLLAIVYNRMCNRAERRLEPSPGEKGV